MMTDKEKTLKVDGQTITYNEAISVICRYCHCFIDEDEEDANENNFNDLSRFVRSMRERLGGKDNQDIRVLNERAYELYVEDLGMEREAFLTDMGLSNDEIFDCTEVDMVDEDSN